MIQHYKNFFSVLNTKVKFVNEVRKEYSKVLSSDFNSLDFWNVGENKVSEIITFFLNPHESHGHDDLYLNLFIKKFNLEFNYKKITDVKAVVEKRTHNNRRIDIFITGGYGKSTIAIENKIYTWTKDQINQIDDYLKYLDNYCGNQNFTLFYLAPKGKTLSGDSYDHELFLKKYKSECLKFINYEDDIIPLIHEFAINTENNRVQSFLLDFERKLKQLYMGNSDINETEIIKGFVIENKENLETSFKIFNNLPAIKAELKEIFFKQMVEISHELSIPINENRNRFHHSKLGPLRVAVSFESRGLIYGLVRLEQDPRKKTYPELESLFIDNFQVSEWWSMWRWMYKEIDYSAEFYQSVLDGTAKDKVKNFIITIINSDLIIAH